MNRLQCSRSILALPLVLLLSACLGNLGVGAHDDRQPVPLGKEEARLWAQGEEFDQSLRRAGRLWPDDELSAYLQQILGRLFPEFQSVMRVRVLRAPEMNAFALPHGSIYLHSGLLARLDNEAQAATILAHEGAHFVLRHSLRQTKNVKLSAAIGQTLDVSTGMLGAGALLAVSSISGYSRGMEREADAEAFRRLQQAGYDSREAVAVFRRLVAETEVSGEKETFFFFSSHPRMQERIESFEDLIMGMGGGEGERGEEAFQAATAELRWLSLEEDLSRGRYRSLLLSLEDEKKRQKYPASACYYLGEAYRLRGEGEDLARAEQVWKEAVAASPEFAPTWRALGLLHLKRQELTEAEGYFLRYLELSPEAKDRDYIRQYLEKIDGR
jgi:beta-barrel assembly-enhancing protease